MYSKQFGKASELSNRLIDNGIGTYKERSQHRVLKYFFEEDPSFHEIPIKGFVADICKDNHIYEIQTSCFGKLTPKLEVFLEDYSVTVVYPAATKNAIVWTDPETGNVEQGRCAKRSSVKFKLLPELYYIHKYIGNPLFDVLIVETEVNDFRLLDGRGPEKKIKATKTDKVPVGISSITHIKSNEDIKKFAELNNGEAYTRKDLQKKFQLKDRKLSMAIKTLQLLGILVDCGKINKKIIYSVAKEEAND